jgi:hypothetical protein
LLQRQPHAGIYQVQLEVENIATVLYLLAQARIVRLSFLDLVKLKRRDRISIMTGQK